MYVGKAKAPVFVESLLMKGPKYSLPASVPKQELLATAHKYADLAPGEDRDSFSAAVEALGRAPRSEVSSRMVLRKTAECINNLGLVLLQCDKDGGFAVLPQLQFKEKAKVAIEKNFKTYSGTPSKVESRAVFLLSEMGLGTLSKTVKFCKGDVLEVFFSADTKSCVPYEPLSLKTDVGSIS